MLIGLTGHAGAGKDTAADILCACGWQRAAFADALRLEIASWWSIDVRTLTERQHKDAVSERLCVGQGANRDWMQWAVEVRGHAIMAPRSPRWLMQQWGDFRRATDPLYWVRPVQHWIRHERSQAMRRGAEADLVVTDVRLPNEAQALRAMGGRIVRVHRPGLTALPADTAGHVSEGHTALQADADVVNDGALLDLPAELARAIAALEAADAGDAEAQEETTSYGGTT